MLFEPYYRWLVAFLQHDGIKKTHPVCFGWIRLASLATDEQQDAPIIGMHRTRDLGTAFFPWRSIRRTRGGEKIASFVRPESCWIYVMLVAKRHWKPMGFDDKSIKLNCN